MNSHQENCDLLLEAGRLLLTYNESTEEIHHALQTLAARAGEKQVAIAVEYLQITVSIGNEIAGSRTIKGIHYNNAALTNVHEILRQACSDKLSIADAKRSLQEVEQSTPRYTQAAVTLFLAVGAIALAALLGADKGGAVVAGVSTALGFVVRQWLQRFRVSIFTLPFAAAFVGALTGGVAVRSGWTHTPGLALIVPCLMLVPGPHLINGLLDFIDNRLPMSVARLALANGILLAVGLGLLIGIELIFPQPPEMKQGFKVEQLHVVADMLLASAVTAGFAVFYNTRWPHISQAVAGGAIGHGLRSLALSNGWGLEASTFLGGLAVGLCAAWMSRFSKTPLATVAFAGAVTMMPGLQMYAALRGAVQLARQLPLDEAAPALATLSNGAQAAAVVAALSLGLLIAARASQAFFRERAG